MNNRTIRKFLFSSLAVLALGAGACVDVDSSSEDITNVPQTEVERQSIGNCWLYAQASWAESLHLQATGEEFDTSQSYWTFWHWFDEIQSTWGDELQTGGNESIGQQILRDYGLMADADFVPEDAVSEMSQTQSKAKDTINFELSEGRLSTREARQNKQIVLDVLKDAWNLSEEVRGEIDAIAGEDGTLTLHNGGTTEGTNIIDPTTFEVQYPVRDGDEVTTKVTDLVTATYDFRSVSYPTWGNDLDEDRRIFLTRVQDAMHHNASVRITWNVDFNAMENGDNERRGSFNQTTLDEAGQAGRQGGHITVLHDYQAITDEFGLIEAGDTLDPEDAEDAQKLAALLLPTTQIQFFRVKNSWGALRDDRAFSPGFPGYHDLYMDYLNGPIDWCPSSEDSSVSCNGTSVPLRKVMLPPGF